MLVLGGSTNVHVLVNLDRHMCVCVVTFYVNPVRGCCWPQHVDRGSLCDWLCHCPVYVLCVCLWDMCSASLLGEPAPRKGAAAAPSLGRHPGSLGTGMGSSGRAGESWPGLLEEAAVLLTSLHSFVASRIWSNCEYSRDYMYVILM